MEYLPVLPYNSFNPHENDIILNNENNILNKYSGNIIKYNPHTNTMPKLFKEISGFIGYYNMMKKC
jgi:hypothetical protein